MLEYNVRSTVFLKHRTNWNSVHGAIRSFTFNTILKSADPLIAFDRVIGEVIGRYILTLPLFFIVYLKTCNGLMTAASDLMMLNRLLIVPGVGNYILEINLPGEGAGKLCNELRRVLV